MEGGGGGWVEALERKGGQASEEESSEGKGGDGRGVGLREDDMGGAKKEESKAMEWWRVAGGQGGEWMGQGTVVAVNSGRLR